MSVSSQPLVQVPGASKAALAWRIGSLAWPVLVAQLASIGMMVIDTIVVGRHSTDALAAVAVGSSFYISVMLALTGVIQALLPTVAQLVGAGQREAIGPAIRQGLWLALGLSVAGGLVLFFPHAYLAWAQLQGPVEAAASEYLRILVFSLPAHLAFRVFQGVANAVGRPRTLMLIGMGETLLHGVFATVLVHGYYGGAALGAQGAAWSQLILAWLVCVVSLGLLLWKQPFAGYRPFSHFEWPSWAAQREMLRLGIPMGLSYLVEVSAFTLMAVFVARLGPEVVGGHRIVANLSAVTYMLPLSLATATAALVGQAVGAGDGRLARRTALSGILLACGVSTLAGVLLWLAREFLVAPGSPDPRVQGVALGLIGYIAFYQFFDAAQTVAAFALRGYKVTFLPLLIHVGCFWGLGLGGGWWLAFQAAPPQGAAGFWQGAVLATVVVALGLGGLLYRVAKTRYRSS